jgi:pimeloyl-ACP methyl ester carboxylesterase
VAVPAGVAVRFLKFTTIDGIVLNGALWEPQDRKPNVAILVVPGTNGNYTGPGQKPVVSFISSGLASKGFAVLVTNNRGSDQNDWKDNAFDIPKDLNAGVSILKSLGYNKIVLLGNSLGGQHVVYYEAVIRDPAVKALVLAGSTASNPWRTEDGILNHLKPADPGLYGRLYKSAKDLMAQGKPNAVLPQQMPFTPWLRSTLVSVSALNFMSYYSPEGIVTTTLIRQVPVPILMVRDQADAQHRSFEAQWLLGNATALGSQVPNAKFVLLPNTDPPSAGAHTFDLSKNGQKWLDTVATWLQEIKLG